jgi:putative oxidoreductase
MKRILVWALTVVSAAMFLMAGTLKLAGVEMQVQLFAMIGIGQWFRYFTGLLEVTGAIALFIPAIAPYAAVLLATVMSGAILTHLLIAGGNPLAAVLLFASTLTIAWLRREQISSARAVAA